MAIKASNLTTVGKKHHDFTVTKVLNIPEIQCLLVELIHEPTGARVMHLANDDTENLFSLSFQTIPTSSNGVAHILEHTVLCGSKNFPVKDPFFMMQGRSLNTFMNALTGADFTCYPAASQVPQDFYNLLEVYIDAVFRPNLKELSFMQEGHRLEFADPNDPNSDLEHKGIVFNEMKGALSNPGSLANEVMSATLFPDITYGVNSGGDPKEIPNLTHQELIEFHKEYYHPSRCLFFFYGNMLLEDHLDFIKEEILDGTSRVPPLPPIPRQPRFTEPKRVTLPYPVSEDEDFYGKALISFGWLTCHILEQEEVLALTILDIVLMDTDASPLKMALLQSGLCKQAGAYIDSEISEIPFILHLRGCNPEDADALEKIIFQTLESIAIQGVPLDLIENAIHQLEFHRSEIAGDHSPFGLSLFMRSALLAQHGGEAEDGLKIHTLFDEVRRKNISNPRYFSELIHKYLLDNKHFACVVLYPDQKLAEKEAEQEKEELLAIKQKLTRKEKEAIVHKAAELMRFQKQQEEEDVEVLPKVSLDDVPLSARSYALNHESSGNIEVYHHPCFTNNIIYADLVFNLPKLTEQELSYLRLMTTILPQMGCNGRNYAQNLEYIQANTGGVGSAFAFNLQANDPSSFFPSLYIRGKCLYRKAPKLFTLLNELASSADFTDLRRLKEVILKHYTSLESTLNQNALRYAINLSASGLDAPSKIANDWYGLEYFKLIRSIVQEIDQNLSSLSETLTKVKNQVMCVGKPDLIITCDSAMYDEVRRYNYFGLNEITINEESAWDPYYPVDKVISQGRTITSPVAFIGQMLKCKSYTHPDTPALCIAAFLFENLTIHPKVREQGGAYGGGAICNAMSGNFCFYSYRDPNIVSSLNAFEDAIKNIVKGEFDNSDLEEAKLEMIQNMDTPLSPGSRGDLAYAWIREGKSLEIRQQFRNDILGLTRDHIISAVSEHLAPQIKHNTTVVFAGKELLEKENLKLMDSGIAPLPIFPLITNE